MKENSIFTDLWVPIVTPFSAGQIDHIALRQLTQHLASQGIAGFVVCGSTGEAAALSKAEQLAALQSVQSVTTLPVIMGVSGYHLEDTVAWVRELSTLPLNGLLVSAPHYIRPSQSGLIQWFTAMADASRLPIIIYDIPSRTGVELHESTLLALSQHEHIVGIKDCGGHWIKTQSLIASGRLIVLAGDDANIFSTVALGGQGAIAAASHVHTHLFVAVIRLLKEGNLPQARALWSKLRPIIDALFAEPNPSPVKALLAHQGHLAPELRAPMGAASDSLEQRLIAMSKNLEVSG